MIVPMKKVSIVVLDSTRKESLKQLRKVGVVHLESLEGTSALLSSYKEASATTDKAISILEEIKVSKQKVIKQISLNKDAASETASNIVALSDRKKSLLDAISQGTNELERLSLWGNVDPDMLYSLAESGIYMYLYEIPEDKYSLIGNDVKTLRVNGYAKTVRFLLLSDSELSERPSALPPEAYSVPLPELSTNSIRENILKCKQEISRIESELLDDKKFLDTLKSYKKDLCLDIEFENVYSGMAHDAETEESVSNNAFSETKLAWITGYVPVDSMKKFKKSCTDNSWAYTVSDPSDEDPVPTKLHNSKIVSIIYPLTDFLDVTPGYHEFDISGWFLLFFCIFFAMIFGDAGYGALVTIVGFILFGKSPSGKKSLPALVTLLGLCTCLWGIMTCSWFGIDSSKLPDALVNLSFYPVSSAKNPEHYESNQKVFCFMLAIIQLSIAHIKCFFADKKSLKCLGDLGSLLQLWGMFYVVMNMVVDSNRFPLSNKGIPIRIFGGTLSLPSSIPFIAIGVLLFGFVLSFIFSNYEGSIGKSVLESCKNIISVLLGVVNVFSDIVSYIRLWAVGLAGAAISQTVNNMAGPMFGKLAIVIFAVVLLVFGHGLNMILNLLSVVVHGVRLNTLEFSQHLGMAWSGTKYRPFKDSED
ncbi:MAG: ATPase [Treponema sp.]|nr:ATPase [Treponema sp.]